VKNIVIAACAALACTVAVAQSKKELVTKVLQLTQPGVEQLARSVAEQPAAQLLRRAAPAINKLPADKRDALGAQVQADVKAYVDEAVPLLRDRAVKLLPETIGTSLEAKFNEDELKGLIAWHESPLNRKFQEFATQAQREYLQKLVNEARPVIEPKLKALDAKIAKRVGIPPAANAASAPGPSASPAR
jgi:uncharacterized protein YqgV (UPF0045/DUF77 family)